MVTSPQKQAVRLPPSHLPVLRTADVAVVGGSLAGVAAALRLRRAGRRVALIEPRTYLGREIAATLRPWVTLGTTSELWTYLIERMAIEPASGEIPLHMDGLKLALEDLVLEAGVDLLYASLPVAVSQGPDGIEGVVIANKSGRQLIAARTLVDAIETALPARLAGGRFEDLPAQARFNRTLEFDRVAPPDGQTLAVPADLGLVNDAVTLHRGYRGPGHIFVSFELELPAGFGPAPAMQREIKARDVSMALAAFLIGNVAGFREATLGFASFEVRGPQTGRMHGPDAQPFAGPVPGLWLLNEAARLEDPSAFREPNAAGCLGEEVAAAILAGTTLPQTRESALGASESAPINLEVREQESPQPGRAYPRRTVTAHDVPVWQAADLVVTGGGTSGASAAITAAREGASVAVVEMNPGLGGTGTIGGVNSYWYGRHVGFAARVEGWTEAVQRTLGHTKSTWNIEAKMYALLREAADAGVSVLWNAVAFAALVEPAHDDSSRRGGAPALPSAAAACPAESATNGGSPASWKGGRGRPPLRARAPAVVGCDAPATPLQDLGVVPVNGSVNGRDRVRGVLVATPWGPLAVLGEVVIDATGDGDIAAFAGADFVYGSGDDHTTMWYSLAQFSTPGRTRNNFTSSVEISNVEDYTRAILAGRRRGSEVHDHGVYVAPRESRHILGEVVLTHTDQLVRQHWPDVINVHYSNHDVKGPSTSPWVRMGLIPPNLEVEIPYRALIPQWLDGIVITGKAISATHDALAAIRMQADMENLGGVAALAAVQSLRQNVGPRDIDVPALQRRLVVEALLDADVLGRPAAPTHRAKRDLPALVAALDGARPLYAYSDMEMGEIFTGSIPMVDVCTAGPEIIPYLEQALPGAHGLRRTHLAQVLAFHGSPASVPVLIAEIQRWLRGETLPKRDNDIRHANYPPDQGAMPDLVYLLYSLGMARDRRSLDTFARVVELLVATEDGIRDRRKGTFYYVEAVAWGLERLADPAAIPILRRLHGFPALRDQVCHAGFQTDFFAERQALLDLCIARAQARCGDQEGIRTLIEYLDDVRGLLAAAAHAHLRAITGLNLPRDSTAWLASLQPAQARNAAS